MDPFPLVSAQTHQAIHRNLGCGLFFAEPVAPERHAALEALVPPPLRHELLWTHDFLYAGSDDWFEEELELAYGDDDDDDPTAAFSSAIDAWLRATHAAAPLAFVYATDLPALDHYPAWASRSLPRVADVILPWLVDRWDSGSLGRGGPDHHAATILDNFSYFMLTHYVKHTPSIDAPLRARLIHLAHVICDADTGCGADLWRSELLDRLEAP